MPKLKLLCEVCLSQVECIDPASCCPRCFLEWCRCDKMGTLFYDRLGCAFEYEGPQKSLLSAFKYQDRPYLAKSLAGFMLLQHANLGWELPDIVTYIPQSFLRKSFRGYNQSKLLAQHLAEMLDRPLISLLKRTAHPVRQSLLSKEERQNLPPDTFVLDESADLYKKHLLLIDDVFTTGKTAIAASRTLKEASIKALNVLCLMRTQP